MSLMSAFVVDRLIENNHVAPKRFMLGIWILFFPKSFEPLFAIKKFFLPGNPSSVNKKSLAYEDENKKKDVGLWIRNNSDVKEKVFVAGYGAQIQAYSERLISQCLFQCNTDCVCKEAVIC